MRSEGSVEIDRPIEDVFYLTNDNVAAWSIIVVEDEMIDEKPGKIGSTFRSITEEHGRRMEFQGTITAWDPPYTCAMQLKGQMFDIEAAYSFEDLGSRTKVTQFSTVEGKGFVKPMFLLFGWLMNKSSCDAVNKELQSLRRFCEAQPTDIS
ncbi:MAG: SRPBCC domain-containing protein [Planctomycetaceae bacterium]|nr:SRPBCC domain-containing protein [Planctomycetales bacterium]MCB9921155.1 SRPBCC domain-containing protein [Planctomycetaceae bacterium]